MMSSTQRCEALQWSADAIYEISDNWPTAAAAMKPCLFDIYEYIVYTRIFGVIAHINHTTNMTHYNHS